jgi:ribosomal-protein-serine acetyltransferase
VSEQRAPFRVDLGEGVLLRKYTLDDLDEVWAVIQSERDRLGLWMPWVAGTTTIDHQRTWLERVVGDERSLDGLGIWVDGRLAGGIGLGADPFGIAGEIGYWISGEFEGRGLITRACRALIDHGFSQVSLHRIVIRAGVENTRSRAIPERLGFTCEGVLRGEGRGSRGFYDLVVYGLLEDEWPPR